MTHWRDHKINKQSQSLTDSHSIDRYERFSALPLETMALSDRSSLAKNTAESDSALLLSTDPNK